MPGGRRVRVVTDSTADLPLDLVTLWGIVIVPLEIHFGEESYRDHLDLPSGEFYARLAQGSFPTTSQPPVGTFRRTYERAAAGGGEVISIHLSSALSGTCQTALLAAEQVDAEIAVIDSGLLSMGLGWLVLAAAEAAHAWRGLDEIVHLVEEIRGRSHVVALVENLEHLRRGGRVGQARSMLGSILDIRAILTLREGETVPVERVRTRSAGRRRLVEQVATLSPLEQVAVIHADNPAAARQVADDLSPIFPRQEIRVVPAGQVVATHVGPGAVGVACVEAK